MRPIHATCLVVGALSCGDRDAARSPDPTSPATSVFGEPRRLGAPVMRRLRRATTIVLDGARTTLPAMPPTIGALATTSDGATLVTADALPVAGWPESSEPGITLWDRRTASARAQLGDARVAAVALSGDGALAATADLAGRIQLWDLARRAPSRTLAFEPGAAVALSADGKRVIGVGRDAGVQWWDAASGQPIAAIQRALPPAGAGERTPTVRVAAISRDGDRVAVAGPAVELFALAATGATRTASLPIADARALAFAPDGDALAIGDAEGTVRVFALPGATGPPTTARVAPGWPIRALAMVSASRFVASASRGLAIYDGDREAARLAAEPFDALAVFDRGAQLAAGAADGAVKIFDLATGHELRAAESHVGEVRRVALTATGDVLSVGAWPGDGPRVRRWQLAAGRSLAVAATALAVVGDRLVFQRDLDDPALLVQDGRAAPRQVGELEIFDITAAELSADGKQLALGGRDGAIQVVDLVTGKTTTWRTDGVVQALGFSADGTRLATGGARIHCWRIAAPGKPDTELPVATLNVAFLAFRAGDTQLVTATQSAGLQLWDLTTRSVVRALFDGDGERTQGTADLITAAAQAGRALITGHASGLVRAWDLNTGAERAHAARHTTVVTAMAASPDGRRLVSADRDGVILVWPLAAPR
jgi:WD40 repeat protein